MLGNVGEQGNRFRQRRFAAFLELVDRTGVTGRPVRIIDLGGRVAYWEALRPMWQGREFEITTVNLESDDEDIPPIYKQRAGNACALPEHADNSFDIVHSNSVIEHVGHWPEMQAMAREVRRLAPHYFVQTPNLWFPLEAHYRYLFFQFLPEGTRARMLLKKDRGFIGRQESMDAAMHTVQATNLIDAGQLQTLFPDASIMRERVAGLTKSITAIR